MNEKRVNVQQARKGQKEVLSGVGKPVRKEELWH